MRNQRLAIGVALSSLIALTGCGKPSLAQCDEAIKATLRSPSTYKRVLAEGENPRIRITYDAVNAFNAPVRGKGVCLLNGNTAIWSEDD